EAADVFDRADSAADGQRHEDLFGAAADDIQHDVAIFMAGGDVEKDELIGAFVLVPPRDFDRIAGIAQIDEVGSLDDATFADVKAGDHTCGQYHGGSSRLGLVFGKDHATGVGLQDTGDHDAQLAADLVAGPFDDDHRPVVKIPDPLVRP